MAVIWIISLLSQSISLIYPSLLLLMLSQGIPRILQPIPRADYLIYGAIRYITVNLRHMQVEKMLITVKDT